MTGACEYDSGDGLNTAYSSLRLDGPVSLLSDITSAAGWKISGCSPTWAAGSHQVALTCSTGAEGRLCDHVLQSGAVGKIVRLPQDCGAGPFARVVSWNRPVGRKRGPGSLQTHTVVLDYDFESADPTKGGEISFSVSASNVRGNSTLSPVEVRSHGRRQLVPRISSKDTIKLPPVKLSKKINLLDQTFSCPANGGVGVDAHLKVDVDVGVNAQVVFGYEASGKFFPPKVTKLALTSTLSGDASAEFDLDASLHGSFDTGAVELLTLGLPGTSFLGIVKVGPQFVVSGQINGDLGAEALVKAGAKWTFPSVSLVFPPGQGKSSAQAEAGQPPLAVSINPRIEINGHLTGHIIPKVLFGIEVGSKAKAEVFVDMDASTTLGVEVHAAASASSNGQASASAGGCVTLDGAIDIAAGATGSIKPIFDKTVSFDIFKKEVNLFRKCFGDEDPAAPPATSIASTESAVTTPAGADVTTAPATTTGDAVATDSSAESTDPPTTTPLPSPTDGALATDSVADSTETASTEIAPTTDGPLATSSGAGTTDAEPTATEETSTAVETPSPGSGAESGVDPADAVNGRRAVRVRRVQPQIVRRGFICPGPAEGGGLVKIASQ